MEAPFDLKIVEDPQSSKANIYSVSTIFFIYEEGKNHK